MAKPKAGEAAINIDKERIFAFLPLLISTAVIIIFGMLVFLPLYQRLGDLKTQIREKESILVFFERKGVDANRLNREIKELNSKINKYEKKLVGKEQANILIGTLKDITAEAYLKFSSIEPQTAKKFSLDKQKDIYSELPIKVKLKCGYYELIDFIAKIEKAGRLMKITDLQIKNSPGDTWKHDVSLFVSTFAKISDKIPDSG